MLIKKTPEELIGNPFSLIGKDWMLLTATRQDGSVNCMTASWGSVGVLWGKPVLTCFIRPQRYTHAFTEEGVRLSASFFPPEYRPALMLCGRQSGRDIDKIAESGLTPVRSEAGHVYYREASLVLCCKKLYTDRLRPEGFADPTLDAANYPGADYHTVYVYEIEQVLQSP